jgi:hypothetical protein
VFVIASARDDIDPAEILFEFEGVRRDTAPSRKEGQRPTASAQDSPRVSGGGLQGRDDCGVELSGPLSARDYKDAGTDGMNKHSAKMVPVMQDLVGALDTECGGNKMSHQTIASGHLLPVKSFYESSLAQYREEDISGTIKASGGVAGGGSETFLAQPIAYSFDSLSSNSMKSDNPNSGCNPVDVSRSLDTSRGLDPSCNQGGIGIAQPVSVYENHPADSRVKEMGEVCSTVTSRWGTGGGNMPIVSQPIPIHSQAMNHNGKNHDKARGRGNGLGIGQEGDPMNTLTRADRHAVAQPIAFEPGKLKRLGYGDAEPGLSPALRAEAGDNQVAVAQPLVLMDQGGGVMNVQTDGTVGTLRRETHGHEPVIMQPIPIDSMNHLGRSNENHSMGDFVPGAPSYTLTKGHSHAVAHQLPVCIGGEHPNAGIGIDQAPTLTSAMGTGGGHVPITDSNTQAIGIDSYNLCETGNLTQTLKSPQGGVTESIGAVRVGVAVRRLTPVECERLQGFPDGYTNIPWRKAAESPDGPRYKALGNSWAVPVVAWIGKRIDAAIKGAKHD